MKTPKLLTDNFTLTGIALIVLLIWITFGNTLNHEFIWDDTWVIEHNRFITSWSNLSRLFSRSYATAPTDINRARTQDIGSGEFTYRPVVTATYMLDYALWKKNPLGYHLTNLLLQCANAVLFFYLIRLLTPARGVALAAALIFALHPVHTEAVSTVCNREDLLAFFFSIAAFLCFMQTASGTQIKRMRLYCGSLLWYALAFFSKEISVVLPFLIAAYLYFLRPAKAGRSTRQAWASLMLFAPATLVFLLIWKHLSYTHPVAGFQAGMRLANLPLIMSQYIRWFFNPLPIHPLNNDELRVLTHAVLLQYSISALLIGGLIWAAYKTRRTKPLVAFSVAWLLISLIPGSLALSKYQVIALRFMYVASAGFALLIAALLFQKHDGKNKLFKFVNAHATVILVIILAGYAVTTPVKNLAWRTNITFYGALAEKYPENADVHADLGLHYQQKGLLEDSIKEYSRALALAPQACHHHNGLALSYHMLGRHEQALANYKTALTLCPASAGIVSNIGLVFKDMHEYGQAVEYFNRALAIDERYTLAYDGLAETYFQVGDTKRAQENWETALTINPYDLSAIKGLSKLQQ